MAINAKSFSNMVNSMVSGTSKGLNKIASNLKVNGGFQTSIRNGALRRSDKQFRNSVNSLNHAYSMGKLNDKDLMYSLKSTMRDYNFKQDFFGGSFVNEQSAVKHISSVMGGGFKNTARTIGDGVADYYWYGANTAEKITRAGVTSAAVAGVGAANHYATKAVEGMSHRADRDS